MATLLALFEPLSQIELHLIEILIQPQSNLRYKSKIGKNCPDFSENALPIKQLRK